MVRSTASADTPGVGMPRNIFGYEVLNSLGNGAGSALYAVTHPQTHQVYALKHVLPKTDKDQRFVEQLEAELEVGQLVNHPGLRKSIEMKVNRSFLRKVTEAALVLELFDGRPLEARRPRTLASVLKIFIQVSEAIAALHESGFVHCDLKPNNILIDSERRAKVIDLGQACRMNLCKERIQGTPDYIAPEQVKREPVTARTDVYNLGATMYWALCGKNLPTLFTLSRKENSFLLDAALPSPHEVNPQVPQAVSDLVMECVRVNPNKRPDMEGLIRRLEIADHILKRDEGETPVLVVNQYA